ncbi:hypothetical protein L1887_36570 [Cichorium endivia]|nr:hypothetical protein L1887_36570 [Cichorium endivia]
MDRLPLLASTISISFFNAFPNILVTIDTFGIGGIETRAVELSGGGGDTTLVHIFIPKISSKVPQVEDSRDEHKSHDLINKYNVLWRNDIGFLSVVLGIPWVIKHS